MRNSAPGSCGLPLDAIKDSVPYSVLSIADDGVTVLEEIRLPFSKQEYAAEIGDAQRPFRVSTWEEAYDAWEKSRQDSGV